MKKPRPHAELRRRAGPHAKAVSPVRQSGRDDAILDGLTVLTGYLSLLRQESFGPLTARQLEIVDSLDRTVCVLVDLVSPNRRNGR